MKQKPRDDTQPRPVTPAESGQADTVQPREIGGPKGLEPTRYGDWEYNGRCTDF
jgi:hypothetical protein